MLRVDQLTTWTNWAGTASTTPVAVAHPATSEEVAELVVAAARRGLRVKAVGSGHSFTAIAITDGVLLQLDRLTGFVAVDAATHRVTVRAGTPLHVLNAGLAARGLAMVNLGDIDRQTISGALATGTHGTGARFQGLAAAVVGTRIVLADGTIVVATVMSMTLSVDHRVIDGALGAEFLKAVIEALENPMVMLA